MMWCIHIMNYDVHDNEYTFQTVQLQYYDGNILFFVFA